MDHWDVHEKYRPLQSSSVLYACTPASSDMMCSCISSSIFQAKVKTGRVQAWPKPLDRAGLNQNLHQPLSFFIFHYMEEVSSETETGGMDHWDVHGKYRPLQSSSVLYACTLASSDMMSSCISSSSS
ncbi:hypothetical protein OIU84_020118 [Salix udensis]|uniref:Uncharacterized protein n=1 Tax=Salix udensis TaxID=889485 RepID=A0AAD6L0G9_9ROSI|nr:hypothetical protein OIU84_020118 [Salix udensis]